jgi:hypothetical protein
MQEGQLLMTQAQRDRLVTLSIRQVKRLLYGLKKRGDKAVVHGLRGKPSTGGW